MVDALHEGGWRRHSRVSEKQRPAALELSASMQRESTLVILHQLKISSLLLPTFMKDSRAGVMPKPRGESGVARGRCGA